MGAKLGKRHDQRKAKEARETVEWEEREQGEGEEPSLVAYICDPRMGRAEAGGLL